MTPSFFAMLPLGWSIYVTAVWLAVVVVVALNIRYVLPPLLAESWAWLTDALSPPAVRGSLGTEATVASARGARTQAVSSDRGRS